MTKARDDKGAETTANTRATTSAVARAKASEPMAKTNEDEMAEATNDHSTEIREDAMAKTNNTEAAETREDAGTKTEQDIRTESKEDASSFLDTVQAIAAEASDYSRRSLESSSSFVTKLLGAKSFDSVIHIDSEFAKMSYEGFLAQAKKMGELYSDLAKAAFKPMNCQ